MLFAVAYAIIDACLRTVFVAFEKDCVKRMVVIRLQSKFFFCLETAFSTVSVVADLAKTLGSCVDDSVFGDLDL